MCNGDNIGHSRSGNDRDASSVTFPESLRPGIERYIESWDAAEAAIKEAELFRGQVVFAAIKELRYAGRKFCDAMRNVLTGSGRLELALRQIDEASENCIRARNDAIDATVAYLYKYFSHVKEEYGVVFLNSYYPDFFSMYSLLERVTEKVIDSRAANRPERNDIYRSIIESDLPAIREIYVTVEQSKNIVDQDAAKVKRSALIKMSLIILLSGAIGAFITSLLS